MATTESTTTAATSPSYVGVDKDEGKELDMVIRNLRAIGMDPKDLPEHEGLQRASILIPLFQRRRRRPPPGTTSSTTGQGGKANDNKHDQHMDWYMLFTQRPMHLKSHPGEVCFPGGRQDPEDGSDDVKTAVREVYEEIGLAAHELRILCRLETVESYSGLCVTPIVAVVNPMERAEPINLQVSRDEVESAFAVPMSYFAQDDNCASVEDMVWGDKTVQLRTYNYHDNDVASGRTYRIWGLTAHVAYQVVQTSLRGCKDATPPAAVVPSMTKSHGLTMGTLLRWEEGIGNTKPYWVQRFFVLTGNILHQYDSEGQASRKAAAATKKNRLPLIESAVEVMGHDDDNSNTSGGFDFVVTVLNGRAQWRLRAPTLDDRAKWLLAISSASSSEQSSINLKT